MSIESRLLRRVALGDQPEGEVPAGYPGKSTMTSRLAARPPTSFVFRMVRDANGVAPDAEAFVAEAASSSGHALPSDLRTKFESSLGADLSSVRVHTGAESADAASAVGAKAYTTGQDIHFAEGHYDPSSAFGVHLLAHEVAHTVQQQGAAPTRQNKLEVSSPQDGAEHEADRAADAMVWGAPVRVTARSGVMRKTELEDAADEAGARLRSRRATPSR